MLEHLPVRDRPAVRRRLGQACRLDDDAAARERLSVLAEELERSHPGAAASLREGLEETLTVTRLGVRGALRKTLASSNPCESIIECVRRSSRNVKHWQSGEMCLRWTAAGMLEAERQFRRIVGYRDLASSRSPSSVRSPQSVTSEEHGAQFRALEYRGVPKARVGNADGVSRLCGRAPWTTISRPL